MEPIYIVLIVLGGILFLTIFPTFLISNRIYSVLLVRWNKEKWSRSVSWDDDEQRRMFHEGDEWGKVNEPFRERVEIDSCKFHLVGEYFNFGSDKCVIIIPGRMEAGTYSYYFSEPFKQAGYNVLAIDNRSHGLSEGKYNCLGLKEYKDIINWAKFLHDEKGIKQVILHGICIGSATALYALIQDDTPDYMVGMIADGMYSDFSESFKNHLIEKKKPIFPFNLEVMMMVSLVSGKGIIKNGPIKLIHKLNKPILFLYSHEDTYSTEDQSSALWEACKAPKKFVWFDKGVHSHIRINAPEKYDAEIKTFIEEYFSE